MSGSYKFDPSDPSRAYSGKVKHNDRRRAKQGRQKEFQNAARKAQDNENYNESADERFDRWGDHDYSDYSSRYTTAS